MRIANQVINLKYKVNHMGGFFCVVKMSDNFMIYHVLRSLKLHLSFICPLWYPIVPCVTLMSLLLPNIGKGWTNKRK